MIFNFILNFIVLVIGAIFSMPIIHTITTLPAIGGFDLDGALITGVGQFYSFIDAFWPLQDLFYGLLALLVYYTIKIGLQFLLGHRAPGSHS